MTNSYLADRVITCLECLAENTLIGSDLGRAEIFCSQCGSDIGPWTETHDRHVETVADLGRAYAKPATSTPIQQR